MYKKKYTSILFMRYSSTRDMIGYKRVLVLGVVIDGVFEWKTSQRQACRADDHFN